MTLYELISISLAGLSILVSIVLSFKVSSINKKVNNSKTIEMNKSNNNRIKQ